MIETVSIPCYDDHGDPVDYGIRAVAIRLPKRDGWYVLYSALGDDCWLAAVEYLDLPENVRMHPGQARYNANMSLLLGDPWSAFWEDAEATVRRQQLAMVKVGRATEWRLHHAWPEDTAAWRAQFQLVPVSDGELLLELLLYDMLGADPEAGRN